MAGLDVFVFTGGIGENSVMIRARVLSEMSWLGIALDEKSNLAGDTIISNDHSKVLCLKLHTDEERVIARQTLELAKHEMALN
jgi:acetate kinase